MKSNNKPFTKVRFNELKKRLEEKGFKVKTKYRKGLKTINLEPIVLSKQT